MEFFCKPETSDQFFEVWQQLRLKFYASLGLNMSKIRLRPHAQDELAHYSNKCTDVEYEFPFGWKELEGIAHRGAYDLTQHSKFSGKDLTVHDEPTNTHYTPEVVECSVGTDRLLLTILFDAYQEDTIDGEERIVLNLHPSLAPIKAAFFPLSKKLNENTYALYQAVAQETGFDLTFDDSGSIGKRYRRQDEIGTPFCITYDFESLTDNCVTIRDRSTTTQQRIAIDRITEYLKKQV